MSGSRLDQQQALHRGVALAADDDVVVHGDAERLRRVDDLLGHLDVGAGRCGVAGWVVVELPPSAIYHIEKYI